MSTTTIERTQPVPTPAQTQAEGGRRSRQWLPYLLIVGLAALFLIHASSYITQPFGESHDGRNASVWGLASRSVREDGVVKSHFGGQPVPGLEYATHPPLIIGETVAAELIGGEHHVVTRAPGWLGSLIALVLMAALLRDLGLSRLATAVGITVAFGSAMFFVYGTMLDTFDTCLPFSLALLLVWQRARQGRPWHPAVLGAVSCLAVLAGWQSTTLLGMCGVVALYEASRRKFPVKHLVAMAIGGVVGLTVTLVWIRWVYGSFDLLVGQANYRQSSTGLLSSISPQVRYLASLLPLALPIGVVGLFVAAIRPATRTLALTTSAAVVGYALLFHGGASLHDYWNYSVLIPLAVGTACLADFCMTRVGDARKGHLTLALVAVPLLCLANTVARPTWSELEIKNGRQVDQLVPAVNRLAPSQGPAFAWVFGSGEVPRWMVYETHHSGLLLASRRDLQDLGKDDPTFPVLLQLWDKDAATAARLRRSAIAEGGGQLLVPAARAAQILNAWPWPAPPG